MAQHELPPRVQAVPALQPLHDVRAGRPKAVVEGKGLAAGGLVRNFSRKFGSVIKSC